MNIKKAWRIISENVDHGYEGDECEEMEDYIKDFEEAVETLDHLLSNYEE